MISKEGDEHEITRYILYGYVGINIRNIDINERQKTALSKMSFLTAPQFECLIKDVRTEINRRATQRKISKNDNPRLANLIEKKFRDLVIDLFFVFNKKFPSKNHGNAEETEIMIFNLENLIHSLKNEDNNVINDIRMESSLFEKIKIYQDYLKGEFNKQCKSTRVLDYMDAIFESHDELLLDILNTPKYFLGVVDKVLKNHLNYKEAREKYMLSAKMENTNQVKRYILEIIELILFNDSYNFETNEAMYLLQNNESSDVNYNRRLDQLFSKVQRRANKLGFEEKEKEIVSLRNSREVANKEEKICYLAEILKNIIINDRGFSKLN